MKPETLKRIAEWVGYPSDESSAYTGKTYLSLWINGEWTEYTGLTPEQSMEILKKLLDEGCVVGKDRDGYWITPSKGTIIKIEGEESLEQCLLMAAEVESKGAE